ncbi:MAG: sigma-70 family RNA polymerase sigma factor [Candidatus Didemnitutus sp.]|nr:sigma-70 family RNA polymerase sigma factor [Candidatus Didemnitutus sp.]
MSSPDETSDEAAMLALQHGEEVALNTLMRRWEVPLRSFLYRSTHNEQDALDLAQETFVRIFRHRARYRAGARFSTWMFQIALNLARDHARYRGRRPTTTLTEVVEPSTQRTPARETTDAETAAAVRDAINALPEELRETVLLSTYQGLSHAEIAEIVDATPKAVETRLYRAREKLRGILGRYLRD